MLWHRWLQTLSDDDSTWSPSGNLAVATAYMLDEVGGQDHGAYYSAPIARIITGI